MQTLTANAPAPAPASLLTRAAALLLIWMSWSGCHAPKIIPPTHTLLRVEAGRPFTAPCDGWFLSDALYHRTRRAVADRILELESTAPAPNP
ncbi:hypothetical protein NXS98_14045 [Fontisphaera persica]|uniref:hypothetical protein n=1 Tax=Fontisphaera persica TaxID=2974023 RepID=UPI0024C0D3D0|nr:hypothetical protein [Fontisphaera persica]WCJ58829.1 hypothetical protein NXS98_14045 [Fontisphaera persica]